MGLACEHVAEIENIICTMDGGKKQPELFKANLFSPSGGLSLGLGDESFSSPLSLAPALGAAASQTPNTKRSSSPAKQSPSSTPPRQSPKAERRTKPPPATPGQPATSGSISMAELSTVPLDSPTTTTTTTRGPMSTPIDVLRSASEPAVTRSFGWNDPPMLSQFSQSPRAPPPSRSTTTEPLLETMETNADTFPIQPFANQPGMTNAASSFLSTTPPTNASLAGPSGISTHSPAVVPTPPLQPQQHHGGPANPYRMGTGMAARKPAYGASGIASYSGGGGGPPPSHPAMVGPASSPEIPPMPVHQPQGPPPVDSFSHSTSSHPPPPLSSSTASHQPPVQWGSVQPVSHHWFYLRDEERYWIPFSLVDCRQLEDAFIMSGHNISQEVLVPTDGGRYDVSLHSRQRKAVYWEEPPSQVRRCSWFYKGEGDRWYHPYDEEIASKLEEEYLSAMSQGNWNRRVELPGGEVVILHSPSTIMQYPASQFRPIDHQEEYSHPRSVLRGFAEANKVEQGEQSRIDHLVFVVHGIGRHCDLSFRTLIDCVDDFREVAQLMLKTHRFTRQAPQEGDSGGRVEFLPVHWHSALHGDDTGVDCRLKPLTLQSITRLREFTNSTLLDILFYTSPIYCQTIVNKVALEMNHVLELFKQRNPRFQGGVSVMGHSLGSCVLFDILDHQRKLSEGSPQEASLPEEGVDGEEEEKEEEEVPTLAGALAQLGLTDLTDTFAKEKIDFDSFLMCSNDDLKELGIPMGPRKKLSSYISDQAEKQRIAKERKAREAVERLAREKERQRQQAVAESEKRERLQGVKFVKGTAGTGQPFIDYPQLTFEPQHLFAVGSPIGLFLTVRGVEELGPEFHLPSCPRVYNVFHPFDPVAYRVEPLVCDVTPERPVLMPHHKGRKRFHLELYENLGQVGASIKQHLVDGMRNMWHQLNEIARSHTSQPTDQPDTPQALEAPSFPEPDSTVPELVIGQLNKGRRIDYVLQEKPIEKLNEYLFALSSHLCYWRSEDTALFILKEVYCEPNPELIKS